jgi:hypothetical protein
VPQSSVENHFHIDESEMYIRLQSVPTRTLAFAIVVVDPKAQTVQSQLTVAPTATFGAASTALLYGKDYWMSSFRGDRIIRLNATPDSSLSLPPQRWQR